jgi:hypothetical protein
MRTGRTLQALGLSVYLELGQSITGTEHHALCESVLACRDGDRPIVVAAGSFPRWCSGRPRCTGGGAAAASPC